MSNCCSHVELTLDQKDRIAQYKEMKAMKDEERKVKPIFRVKSSVKRDASDEARVLADEKFLRRNKLKFLPEELGNAHSLSSIN